MPEYSKLGVVQNTLHWQSSFNHGGTLSGVTYNRHYLMAPQGGAKKRMSARVLTGLQQ